MRRATAAWLLERGARPPRPRDIVELLHLVAAQGWLLELEADDAVLLNSVHRGRYPTEAGLLPRGDPDASDARRAVAAARIVLKRVTHLLGGAAGTEAVEPVAAVSKREALDRARR